MNEAGLHRDDLKPRLADMMPAGLIREAGLIWALNNAPTPEYPQGKYPDVNGEPNYKSGIRTTRLLDSAMRHLLALIDGEDVDPESNRDHAGHLLCNLAMFWWMRDHRPDLDNRPGAAARVALRIPPSLGGDEYYLTKMPGDR